MYTRDVQYHAQQTSITMQQSRARSRDAATARDWPKGMYTILKGWIV